MQKTSDTKYKRIVFLFFLTTVTVFLSCTDKKEYKMELAFQRGVTAQSLYENDRLVKRIEKEVADNGNREVEVRITNHAKHIAAVRNKYIDSMQSVYVLINNIKPTLQQTGAAGSDDLALLNYYQTELKAHSDSLTFQKFLNVYLTFEKKALDEDLSMVSGSCNWGIGLTAHIIKSVDTVSTGNDYELTVVPDMYDHTISYVSNDCRITVFKDEVAVDVKPVIQKRGAVFLISLLPINKGVYKIKGTFTQRAHGNSYAFTNVFTDTFVVK